MKQKRTLSLLRTALRNIRFTNEQKINKNLKFNLMYFQNILNVSNLKHITMSFAVFIELKDLHFIIQIAQNFKSISIDQLKESTSSWSTLLQNLWIFIQKFLAKTQRNCRAFYQTRHSIHHPKHKNSTKVHSLIEISIEILIKSAVLMILLDIH